MPGLEDLYREIILDHYRNPRNKGTLDAPPAIRTEGHNPLCGDEVQVYVIVRDGLLDDIRVGGQGCSISQSSASMMSSAVKGKSVDEARALLRAFRGMMSLDDGDGDGAGAGADGGHRDAGSGGAVKLGDLEALRGVVKFPVRIKCATLAWNTLAQGLDEADGA
jgi:nitrogen fixation NifU-like protein